jgi:hypothetical protein
MPANIKVLLFPTLKVDANNTDTARYGEDNQGDAEDEDMRHDNDDDER